MSRPCDSCTEANLANRSCHVARHSPTRFRPKDTLGGDVLKSCTSVSLLLRATWYKAGYCSWSVALPSQLSSQKRIAAPSLMAKNLKWHKCFFATIRPAQKCESLGFQQVQDKAFDPKYFLHRSRCQPSSVRSLNSHLLSSAVFLTWRSWIPCPPRSLGRQTTSHLSSLYFFFSLSLCQKKRDLKQSILCSTPLGT